MPRLRAAAGPALSWRTATTGSGHSGERRNSSVPSLEPSDTTTTSGGSASPVCPAKPTSAPRSWSTRLYVGMTTLIAGTVTAPG